jgi:hypothetical protein
MFVVHIRPRGCKAPRVEFARTDDELQAIIKKWFDKAKIQVFEDQAQRVAEYAARERNGYEPEKENRYQGTKAKLA